MTDESAFDVLDASVVVVAYGVDSIDLSWAAAPGGPRLEVIIVHNDDRLGTVSSDIVNVVNLGDHDNVGFAAGVNRGLDRATGRRVVLVNPDSNPTASHIDALAEGEPEEIRTVVVLDRAGVPNSVVSRYPTPASVLFTMLRLGRLAPRGSPARRMLAPLLGRWGRAHSKSFTDLAGTTWPLAEYWCAGTLCSFDRERLVSVGGFDGRYFLYREDIDLCRRLADDYPRMRIEVLRGAPAVHSVGGSAITADDKTRVLWARWASAALYCSGRSGTAWQSVGLLARAVAGVLGRRRAVQALRNRPGST